MNKGARECSLLCCARRCYLLDPGCIPSLASPSSRANFLPSKRAPVRVLVPSSLCFTTAALFTAGVLKSTTFAGTFAATFLPCVMLTSTLGPLPSHSSLYSPALSFVPLIVVG